MTTKKLINVMAPLLVGDHKNIDSDASRQAWQKFDDQLAAAAKLGVYGVSTDVWWGIIEPEEGKFDWKYYDRMAEYIAKHGLKWIPILSLHQCGGNVGDGKDFVPVPGWVWSKLAEMDGSDNPDSVKFVSEQKKVSNEYVSFWATDLALDTYLAVMKAFMAHYAFRASNIAEINVSLGPSGELRYPSYNIHDTGTDYPTRGGLQCYSSRARRSFRAFVLDKYGTIAAVEKAWGRSITTATPIAPPKDAAGFYQRAEQSTQFGKDFHDWYADSLIKHGRTMLNAAFSVFAAEDAAFKGIDIGAKFPGIHWRIGTIVEDRVELSDRLAELAAGLIRTSGNDWDTNTAGRGYRPLVSLFAEFNGRASRMVLHFTCLEMPDGDGKPEVKSLAHQLVRWVAAEATRAKLPLKGENALSWNLPLSSAWKLMRSVLEPPVGEGPYEGLTILRLSDILGNENATKELRETIEKAAGNGSAAA